MLAATSTRGLPARRVVTPVLLALIFLVSLPAVTARIYASDEVLYFSFLRSVWFDHDLSFENEYQWFYDHGVSSTPGFHETYLERTTETGLRINFGTIGCALLWAPFYAVGDLVARGLHAAGRNVAVDGYSRPYVAASHACHTKCRVAFSARHRFGWRCLAMANAYAEASSTRSASRRPSPAARAAR